MPQPEGHFGLVKDCCLGNTGIGVEKKIVSEDPTFLGIDSSGGGGGGGGGTGILVVCEDELLFNDRRSSIFGGGGDGNFGLLGEYGFAPELSSALGCSVTLSGIPRGGGGGGSGGCCCLMDGMITFFISGEEVASLGFGEVLFE